MTLNFHRTVAGRNPQGHATFPAHQRKNSTTPYYDKVLRHTLPHPKVPQNKCSYCAITSITKDCSSTAPWCSLLQSATPDLLCATHHCSCTTLYYTVPIRTTQSYSILQCTTPGLVCTTNCLFEHFTTYYSRNSRYQKKHSKTSPHFPVLLRTAKYVLVPFCTTTS